jgi:hypothetical protein
MLTGTTIWFSRALEHSRGKAYSVVVGNARLCTCGEMLAVLSLEINVPTGLSCGAAGPTLPPTFSGGRCHRIPCAALACVDWMSCKTPTGTLLELYGSRQSHGVWIIRRTHTGPHGARQELHGTQAWLRRTGGYFGCMWAGTGRMVLPGSGGLPQFCGYRWLLAYAGLYGRLGLRMSCAGYTSGADGSNSCPAGSVRIETQAACRTAAAAAGKTAGAPFAVAFSTDPRGCYYFTSDNSAYFNTHPVGAGYSTARLLCAAVTGPTGALLSLFWGQCVELSLA